MSVIWVIAAVVYFFHFDDSTSTEERLSGMDVSKSPRVHET